jgi:CheY-like chemotaxis protein
LNKTRRNDVVPLRPRLLLVEDDAGRIDLFSKWLDGTEFVLVTARSGGQAIGMLKKGLDGVAGVMLDHDLSDSPLTSVDAQLSSSALIPLLQRRLPRHVPVLIHSHNLNKPVTMQRALEASGHSVNRIRFSTLMREPARFVEWLEDVRDNWDSEGW